MSSNTKTSGKLSLSNHLLIAMPGLNDPNFHQSVSYICEHNEEGAMGLVINRPLYISFADLCEQLEIEINDLDVADYPIFEGGPVEMERGFILHSPIGDWDSTLVVIESENIGLTMSKDIIQAIADGYDSDNNPPEQFIMCLGYAGWGPGQLEEELSINAWLSCQANMEIIFNTPVENRWQQAAQLLGVDLQLLSHDAGHA